jgi:hypothetical protein
MRYILPFLLLLIAIQISKAQAPSYAWVNQSQSSGFMSQTASRAGGNAIAVDNLGNSYITGSFFGHTIFGSTSLYSTGEDIYLAKYDATGNVLWAKKAGGISWDASNDIALDHSGNIYITGFFLTDATFGSITLTNTGGMKIFVAKYDASGNVLWAKKAGGVSGGPNYYLNRAHGVAVDSIGNCFVTGQFEGSAYFGSTSLISNGDIDIFTAKYDASGNLLWAKQAGSTGSDAGSGIVTDRNGNCYITGNFSGTATFGTTTLTSSGGADIFTAKYDAAGNVLWVKQAGGVNGDGGNQIATDGSGNSYVTGAFSDTAAFGSINLFSNGGADVFIAKYGPFGNVIWVSQAGGTSGEGGAAIKTDGSNNCYVTGVFSDTAAFGSTSLFSNGNWDVFIAKYDASGNALWAKKAGGTGYDESVGIAIDSYGNCYVTGEFDGGSATFDSTTLNEIAGGDMFIAKINSAILSTSELTSSSNVLTVEAHQNPFNQELLVKLGSLSPKTIQLTLTDVLGRVIEQRQAGAEEYRLNTGYLEPGLYLLHAQQDGISRQLKVLKAR